MDLGKLIAIGGAAFLVYLYLNKEAFTLEPQGTQDTTAPATTPTNDAGTVLNGGGGFWAGSGIDTIDANTGFKPSLSLRDFTDWINGIPVGGGGSDPSGGGMPSGGWVIDARTAMLDGIDIGSDPNLDLSPTYGWEDSGGGGAGADQSARAIDFNFWNVL